jgi:hypothetical protein
VFYQRAAGVFYWQENGTSNRGSLRTKDRAEAQRLVDAKNEAHKQPTLNLALGRAYLSAHDPRLCTRTWHRHGRNVAPRPSHDADEVRPSNAQPCL